MTQPTANAKPAPRLVVDMSKPQPQGQASPQQGAPKADAISIYIALEIEARQCANLESLRLAITNSTRKLAAFDEAFLAEPLAGGGWQVTCAAGVHKIDRHAPFVQLMDAWLTKSSQMPERNPGEAKLFDLKGDAIKFGLDAEVAFAHVLWVPIKGPSGKIHAALLALKAEQWRPQTVSMLIPLSSAYGHAWQALQPQTSSSVKHALAYATKTRIALALSALAVLCGFIPVPMSSLAPAEIIARQPALVTAPMDAVIADILQPPGALVDKDAPLVVFTDVDLRNNFELAKRNKAVAQAKYFKAVQNATASQKEVEDVAVAKAELDVAAGDLAYADEMLKRTHIKADRAGLLIYSSKSDWIGRPVKTGERIMEIGDPSDTELKIDVPVSDALTLREGGDVALFLDGDPLTAVKARITRANYRPAPNAENQLVYRIHASFADGVTRRIGLRGVARVSAHDVPLAFYLFRRPIAALRQRFGV